MGKNKETASLAICKSCKIMEVVTYKRYNGMDNCSMALCMQAIQFACNPNLLLCGEADREPCRIRMLCFARNIYF